MYEYIQGQLISKQADHVIVESGSIGYRLKVSFSTFESLPQPGEPVKIFTYLHVREDIHELFGFENPLEREFFFKLIAISKIGPKVALAILSGGSPADISNWVLSEDAKTIAKTPGIGPTTAKRIILELKPKIEKGLGVSTPGDLTSELGAVPIENEAILALEALGYTRSEVFPKIKQIMKEDTGDMTTERLIKLVLKR